MELLEPEERQRLVGLYGEDIVVEYEELLAKRLTSDLNPEDHKRLSHLAFFLAPIYQEGSW